MISKNISLLLFLFVPFISICQSLDPYAFYLSGNDGDGVHVQDGALLHIQGGLTISDSASMYNDGVVELKGDFENTAGSRFQPIGGSGNEKVVKFIGDSLQAIIGDFNTPSSATFYNLVVDKGTSGSAVQLQTAVRIDGSLVFGTATTGAATYTPTLGASYTNNLNKGVIQTYQGTSDYDLFLANGSPDAIKGYPVLGINRGQTLTNSFIQTRGTRGVGQGGFSRSVTVTGVNYVFPIGTTANGFQAVRFNFLSVGPSTNAIRGLFCDGSDNPSGYVGGMGSLCVGCGGYTPESTGANILFGTPSVANPCSAGQQQWVILDQSVKNHGYWSFEGDSTNQYTMETFPQSFTTESMQANPESNETWRTLKYTSDVTDNPSGSGDDWSTQILSAVPSIADLLSYTRNAGCYSQSEPGVPGGRYTGFSHFMISSSKTGNALPVELLYLDAEPRNNSFIQLSWATSSEINNSGFEVYRSTDGIQFEKIGWVEGQGNTTEIHSYTFDDYGVEGNKLYYYTLRQLDLDGKSSKTHVVSARLSREETMVIGSFMPNPASDATRLVIQSSSFRTIHISIIDMLGRKVSETEHQLQVGENILQLDTHHLADATYSAVIQSDGESFFKKLVIHH